MRLLRISARTCYTRTHTQSSQRERERERCTQNTPVHLHVLEVDFLGLGLRSGVDADSLLLISREACDAVLLGRVGKRLLVVQGEHLHKLLERGVPVRKDALRHL